MTLKDYMRVLQRRWLLVVAATLLSLSVAVILTLTTKPTYEAATNLFVTTPAASNVGETYEGNLFSQQRVASYAELVTSEDVLAQTVDALKLDTAPETLAGQITATAVPETVLINITVTDSSPMRAAQIANTVSEIFASRVANLETPDGAAAPMTRVVVAQQASVPQARTSPNNKMNVALGGVVGVLAGFALALLAERFKRTVGDREDVEKLPGATVLATLPRTRKPWASSIVDFEGPSTPAAEAYRCLATILSDPDARPRATVVTSPESAQEKTAAVANLAAALADTGATVCLVDGDLRTRALSAALGKTGRRGLTTVLDGEAGVQDVLSSMGDVMLLSSGPSVEKPSRLLGDGFARVLAELRTRFDHVIVDAPPLPQFADAVLMSRTAESVLIVARPNKTKRALLSKAVELLSDANSTVFDIVLVGARRRWLFTRGNPQPAKTIEVTKAPNASHRDVRNGKRVLTDEGPWAVPRMPSPSTNGH